MLNLKTKLHEAKSHADPAAKSAEPDLAPAELFEKELEREIFRSDRSGSPLTLLLFDLRQTFADEGQRKAAMNELARALCRCSRRTDSRGWFRDTRTQTERAGLLLHSTTPQKAARIIRSVRTCLADNGFGEDGWPREISCEILAYPPDTPINDPHEHDTETHDSEQGADRRHEGNGHHANGNGNGNGATGQNGNGHHRESHLQDFGDLSIRLRSRHMADVMGRPLPLWKRSLDILGAGIGLLLLSPLLLLIAAAIKITSPGPIFFKQERIGYLGRPFLFWKFRSMRHNYNPVEHQKHLETLIAEENGSEKPMVKLDKGNPAITPIGRLLRLSSLDELPQLINVLRGEMSLIGPRPCLRYEAEKYLCWHSRRFDVVPGMTGLWQVNGKNRLTFKEMIRYDIEYARHCSFLLDMKILLQTLPTIWNDIKQGIAPQNPVEVPNVRQA